MSRRVKMNAVIAMLTIGTATLPAAGLELQNTGNLAVRWNAESLVSGETLRQGKVSLMSEDDQEKTITDNAGWRVCNRWNDKAFLPFRREAAIAPDGNTVEINVQTQVESYRLKEKMPVTYSLTVERNALRGKSFLAIAGRTTRPTVIKGTENELKKLHGVEIRWLEFDGEDGRRVVFDFNPEGVTSYSDYGPNWIQGLWKIHIDKNRLTASVGRAMGFVGGALNSKVVIFTGKTPFDQRHAQRSYAYMSDLPVERLWSFGAEKFGGEYQAAPRENWQNPEMLKTLRFAPTGALYAAVSGKGKNIFRTKLPRPGLYLITLRSSAGSRSSGRFSIRCNGKTAADSLRIPAQTVTTVCFPQWIENGEATLEFDGNWQISTAAFQLLLHREEDFKFRRGFWRLSGEFEPSVMHGSGDYAAAPRYRTAIDSVPLAPHDFTVPKDFQLNLQREVLLPPDDGKLDWRYFSALGSLGPSNTGNFSEFNTAEKIERRMNELQDSQIKTVIINGFLARHIFPEHRERVIRNLKAVAQAAHKRKMKVIDHQDLTLLWNHGTGIRNLTARTPELLKTVDTGLPTRGFCLNNPELKSKFYESVKELARTAEIDGIMVDEVSFFSRRYCGCPHCRASFTAETGLILPMDETSKELQNKGSVLWKAWQAWRMKAIGDWWVGLRRAVSTVRTDFTMMKYTTHYGWYSDYSTLEQGVNLVEAGRAVDFLGTEIMSRNVMASRRPVLAFRKMKSAIAHACPKPIFGLVYHLGNWDIAYFGWALNNMNSQITWFIDPVPAPAKGECEFTAFRENINLKNSRPLSDTAILFSMSSKDWAVNFAYHAEPLGISELLSDLHIPNQFILEESLTREKLAEFKKLMVLNASSLTVQQMKSIREFASAGGKVFLSAHAGICDNLGNLRKDWPFSDLFGFRPELPVKTAKVNSLEYKGQKLRLKQALPVVKRTGTPAANAKAILSDGAGRPLAYRVPCGKGELIYCAPLLGAALMEKEQSVNQRYDYRPDSGLRRLALEFLRDQLGADSVFDPLAVPEGVMTSLTSQQEAAGTALTIHFLNATGIRTAPGDQITGRKIPGIWKPLAEPVVFLLKAPHLKEVYAVSPDYAGQHSLAFRKISEGVWRITLPPELLQRYTLVFAR